VTAPASLTRSGGLVAPALTFLNVAAYLVTVVGANRLSKDDYGELIALLGVVLVVCVPGIAVQAVVARATAAGTSTPRALLLRSVQLGAVAAVGVAVLAPAVSAFLHASVLGALLIAVQVVPFTALSGSLGLLQGSERFGRLALVIVVQGLARAAGLVPLLLGGSTDAVLGALAVAMFVGAGIAIALAAPTGGPATAFRVMDVVHATSGILALLVLANVDVLLARNVLSGAESGRYSVGAVLAKAAFWLPQAVAVVVFPRLADPVAGRALLRRCVLLVAGLGAVEVLGCLLLAKPVLEITFGTSYGTLSPIAWLWVVQGAALSVVQLLVFRAIATNDRTTGYLIGAAAVLESAVVLAVQPTRPGQVIAVAATVAALTTAGLLLRRTDRGVPAVAHTGGPEPLAP
jgi:O-antigen/teichoic acid export membrane protein